MGEPVRPWAILFHLTLDILHQSAEAFPLLMPWALLVDIAKPPLHGVRTRTVRREPEQRKTGVVRQPLLNGRGFRKTVVIHDDGEARHCGRWGRVAQQGQERPK